jgi:hypothetical protein
VIGTKLPIWDARYTVVFAWNANVARTGSAAIGAKATTGVSR